MMLDNLCQVIENVMKGVATGINETYSIEAKMGDILEFSFMGMLTQQVTIADKNVINVIMHEDKSFDEAISIGYGSQSKSLLTNSISKVSSKEFMHAPQQDPLAQLQGKVPGLSVQITNDQPGSTSAMFIRGGTTKSVFSDTPLIIVDGVVLQGMRFIQDMNPADIESLEVLKDAASTAIHGAKAANGIILVTTKSGKTGKAKIDFRYTFGVDDLHNKLNLLNACDYVYLMRKSINEDPRATTDRKNKFLSGSFGMSTGNAFNKPNTLEFLDVYLTDYGPDFVANLIDGEGWQTMTDPVTGHELIFMDADFQDVTYRTAYKNEYGLSVMGGDEKATYYAILRYLNQKGIVTGTWYKNYSIMMNRSYRVSENRKVFSKGNLTVGDRNKMSNTTNPLQRAIFMPPTYRLYYEDGTPASGEGMASFRPRECENYYKTKYSMNTQYRSGFQVGAKWTIIDNLKFFPTFYYTGSVGTVSSFEALDEITGTEIRPTSVSNQYNGHIQTDFLMTYDKKIKKHSVSVMAGTTYTKDKQFQLSGSGNESSTNLTPTLNATADSTQRVSSTLTNEAMLSYFGRISYNCDSKYIAYVSFWADGSSRFAKNKR